MHRFDRKTHRRGVLIAVAVYVLVLLLAWPAARDEASVWLKVLLALAPLPPPLCLVWWMARRIRRGDEMQARMQLAGLGAATLAATAFCLVGGFLAISGVLSRDACAVWLGWVFPLQAWIHYLAYWRKVRRSGGDAGEGEAGHSPYALCLGAGTILAGVALWAYFGAIDGWHGMVGEFRLGVLSVVAAVLLLGGIVMAARRRWRR